MKIVELSNKVYLVRHWFVWYRVQRSAAQWDKLSPIVSNGRPPKVATIESAAASLKTKQPRVTPPAIDLTK